jgi:putative oxidoreductase
MIPERLAPQLYAVMRIVFGLMFLTYGLQKFGIGGDAAPFLSYPFGVAGLIETIVGVLLILGLFSGYAAFIAAGEMAVAFFTFHVPMGGLHPVNNQGMPAVLFCFAFLLIAAKGSEIWSVDAARSGK